MQKNYVDRCIEQALKETGGNRAQATKILLSRCLQDQLLEDGLFANFRESVTLAHVQRVAHQLEGKSAPSTGKDLDQQDFSAVVTKLKKNWGGPNPLAASNLKAAPAAPVNKTDSSAEHGSNLRTLADAFKKPDKKVKPKTS